MIHFISLCSIFITVIYAELPDYITRCNLSDPLLNECLKNQANHVLPYILHGDEVLGIPNLSTVKFPRLLLEPKDDFKFDLQNCHAFGAENLQIVKLDIDTKSRTIIMIGDTRNPSWQCNYNVTGKLHDKTFDDTGFANITYTNCIFEYSADYQPLHDTDRIPHYQIKNDVLRFLSVKIIFNLFSYNDAVQSYELAQILNEEYHYFKKEFIPSVKVISATLITEIVNSVFKTVSVDQLFDPYLKY